MTVLDLQADVKPYLSISTDTDDTRLTAALEAAEGMMANLVGSLTQVTVTEKVRGRCEELLLSSYPVGTLTSVTDAAGNSLDVSTLWLGSEGVVRYLQPLYYPWGFWTDYYTVVYTAGFATVPPQIKRAIAALVEHLWRPQRGPVSRGQAADMTTPAPYAVPNFVTQMIADYVPLGR